MAMFSSTVESEAEKSLLTMEQLFFITCDDRISNLLKYKLSGRGIELRELLEADLA